MGINDQAITRKQVTVQARKGGLGNQDATRTETGIPGREPKRDVEQTSVIQENHPYTQKPVTTTNSTTITKLYHLLARTLSKESKYLASFESHHRPADCRRNSGNYELTAHGQGYRSRRHFK
jgi:hypothetical protein